MVLAISFDPPLNDEFDDDRCKVVVDIGTFRGETRYRNVSATEFDKLAKEVGQFPLPGKLEYEWFDGLLKLSIEQRGSLGQLNLSLTLAEEIDFNSVEIESIITYSELQRFSEELRHMIAQDQGTASL